MAEPDRKLLYIAGAGRMGSTLLGKILGQLDGFFYGGEMQSLWRHGLAGEVPCSCRAPVKECEVWRQILLEGFGSVEQATAALRMPRQRQFGPARLPAMMVGPLRNRFLRALSGYRQALTALYNAVYRVTGARVIVDSSQKALYGAILETIPGVALYVVHLTRDPRAFAYSWMKPRLRATDGDPIRVPGWSQSIAAICPIWCLNSLAAEQILVRRLSHAETLRYEDFLGQPRKCIDGLLAFLEEHPARLPFDGDAAVELATSHACFGNHSRFATGRIELRLDDQWKQSLRGSKRALVTLLTWPMIVRYGYPLRGGR